MSSSLAGNGPGSPVLRTKRSCAGPAWWPGRTGSQRDHGATVDSIATLCGPVRRSYTDARLVRQLDAAWARSGADISICTSFSASVKVATDTSGPAGGEVPNAGGAPGGSSVGFCASAGTAATAIAPNTPSDVSVKNSLRDLAINPPSIFSPDSTYHFRTSLSRSVGHHAKRLQPDHRTSEKLTSRRSHPNMRARGHGRNAWEYAGPLSHRRIHRLR